jgi:hypothetical protein
MKTYLTVTISIIVQKTRLSTPKICGRIHRQRMVADEALLERIERRGADIAEHHADRAERERGGAVRRMAATAVTVRGSRLGGFSGSGHEPGILWASPPEATTQ